MANYATEKVFAAQTSDGQSTAYEWPTTFFTSKLKC